MSSKSFCPRCDSYLPPERRVNGYAICTCGWSDSTPAAIAWTDIQQRTIYSLIAFVIVSSTLYAHFANWGRHALAGPALTVREWTGTLPKDGYRRLAVMCKELGKWSCAEKAYLGLHEKKGETRALVDLAEMRSSRGQIELALDAYRSYFNAGGRESSVATDFARLLETKGEEKEALRYYGKAVTYSRNKFNVQATAGVLRVLYKNGQYADAYKLIQAFHRKGPAARHYFNEERSRLETILTARGPASTNTKLAHRSASRDDGRDDGREDTKAESKEKMSGLKRDLRRQPGRRS